MCESWSGHEFGRLWALFLGVILQACWVSVGIGQARKLAVAADRCICTKTPPMTKQNNLFTPEAQAARSGGPFQRGGGGGFFKIHCWKWRGGVTSKNNGLDGPTGVVCSPPARRPAIDGAAFNPLLLVHDGQMCYWWNRGWKARRPDLVGMIALPAAPCLPYIVQ